jgi:hypothetical protein
MHRAHLAVQLDLMFGLLRICSIVVVRHAGFEGASTDDERDRARVVGKEYRRLARRVASADEMDVLPPVAPASLREAP